MLKLAKNSGLTELVSEDGTNPIATTHSSAGSVQEVKVYIFNDAATKRYETITIDPVDSTSTDESTWIALAPDNAGSPGTYQAAGVALSVANISSANVGTPFWVKVTTPTVSDSQNKTDIKLKVDATEFAI